jgi:hypothetical protein
LDAVELLGRLMFHCVGNPGPGIACHASGGIPTGVSGNLGPAISDAGGWNRSDKMKVLF